MGLSSSKTTPSSPSDILIRYYSNNASFRSTYRCQTFPFRDTLIRYITQNPSSANVYQKMIQSCKYFFIKNPIIVIPKLCFDRPKGWYHRGSCPSNDLPNDKVVFLNKFTSKTWDTPILVYLNELPSKIWITHALGVWGSIPHIPVVTSLVPKIYQCDAKSIVIDEQMISFNDLMVMASKCEMLRLTRVVIMNNDEKVPETKENYFETAVSLEALFKALPNVKSFTYDLPGNSLNIITTKTAQELLKIPHFLTLDKFEISETPQIFDINSFYGYIKENKNTKIDLNFADQISDEYKIRLQTIIDEILETENRDYKVPKIVFSGITWSSRVKMSRLYHKIKFI